MAHFGVSLSPALSDKCMYLGGSSSNIDLSEVVNTNITGDNVAEIAGKGVGTGQGSFLVSSIRMVLLLVFIIMCLFWIT